MQLSQLHQRIVSAFLMLVVVALVLWIGPLAFKSLVTLLLVAMIAEWLRLLSKQNRWPIGGLFLLSLFITAVGFGFSLFLNFYLMLAVICATAVGVTALNWQQIEKKWMAVWPLYVFLASALTIATYDSYGAVVLLWVLIVVWATDIGAFFAGRSIGGPKLMPTVSPKKTWSGSVGGLLAAVLSSLFFVIFVELPFALVDQLMLAVVVTSCLSIASQAGDLFESFAKRQHNIKDSSNLLPGHGGVLDRLDGVLIAVPLAYCFLTYFS